jgi:hypothetical protein
MQNKVPSLLGIIVVAVAASPAIPSVTSAAQKEKPLHFAEGKVQFDVQERLRLEYRDNNFDFDESRKSATDDTFLLNRLRLGLLVKPAPWVRMYAQGQDSRELGSRRENVPYVSGAEGDDPFDLRQAFVEIGDTNVFPASVKLGRQELLYGDERLLGAIDWNNFGRTFDAAKVRYQDQQGRFWLDAIYAHVVTIEGRGPDENRGFNFNESNWNDTLLGLYGSTTMLPLQTTDVYLLHRDKESSEPVYRDRRGNLARPYDIAQNIYTIGLRGVSKKGALDGFDYEYEFAYQTGEAAGRLGSAYPNTAGRMLSHQAYAGSIKSGYTFEETSWKPRLGLGYDFGSGDKDPTDDSSESFLNLFHTNHKFYGAMDLFAWKNIHNPYLSLKLNPHSKLTVQLDGHAFWLQTNEDAWYRASGVAAVRTLSPAAREADRFVGTEVDLTVTYAFNKHVRIVGGYSHFFAGKYLEDTAAPGSGDSDADFAFLQTVISF